MNILEKRAYRREYYAKNKKTILARQKEWRQERAEKRKQESRFEARERIRKKYERDEE